MTATVLVVCSDSKNCADWGTFLLQQGYEVVTARSGESSIALCAQLQPDLVLLSEKLSDMPGAEACRQLKDVSRNQSMPVVLVSDSASIANVSLNASDGAHPGIDDLWGPHPTLWEALNRVHSLVHLKTYIDEQAESVVVSLARSIEARDHFSAGHGVRVSNFAVRLGKSMGLSHAELGALKIAGLIHDLGKIKIPDTILFKQGPLNLEEISIVRQHPETGEQICAPIKSLRDILPIIRHHHERWDGSGYPDGLAGDRIPLNARILRVVDVCDALTSSRPYRKSLSLPEALTVLYDEVEKGWMEQDLVNQFASLVVGNDTSATLRKHASHRITTAAQW